MAAGHGSKITSAPWVRSATRGSRPIQPSKIRPNAGVRTSSAIATVVPTLSTWVKRRSRRKEIRPSTSAVEAPNIMMTGASMITATANATP